MRLATSSRAGQHDVFFSGEKGRKKKDEKSRKSGGWWPPLCAPLFARFAPPLPRALTSHARPPSHENSWLTGARAADLDASCHSSCARRLLVADLRVVRCGPFCVASCPPRNCRVAYTPLDPGGFCNGWAIFVLVFKYKDSFIR
jgi:hypothetical protein